MDQATKCLVVMYHYVRDMHTTQYPNIKGLLIEKFKSQIEYLSKRYTFVSIEQYVGYLQGKTKVIPANSCILSFDDGLKDHFTNVFPILKEHNIPGCFFIPIKPLIDHKVLPVQKSQFILAKIGSKRFANQINRTIQAK